jgi:hypothetical protein
VFVKAEQGGGVVHEHVGIEDEETLALYFFASHGHLLWNGGCDWEPLFVCPSKAKMPL